MALKMEGGKEVTEAQGGSVGREVLGKNRDRRGPDEKEVWIFFLVALESQKGLKLESDIIFVLNWDVLDI